MLGNSTKQDISGNGNNTAGRDVIINNYSAIENNEITVPTIIDEILAYVISNVQDHNTDIKKGLPEKLIKAETKIKKNFKRASDIEEVKTHFTYAYINISLIEEKYRLLDNNVQNDIHGHIYTVYKNLSISGNNMEIMRELFRVFLPKGKEMDSQYVNISKAFVLFFFDDCTIFEKTKIEKQMNLF